MVYTSNFRGDAESMDQAVTRSRAMVLSTVVLTAMLIALFFLWRAREVTIWIYYVLVALVLIPTLYLMPLRVGFRDGEFFVKRLFTTKTIPLNCIKSVRVFTPSASDGRIFATNGLYGATGWYKSWEIGLYFAYIGDRNRCFLIRLYPDKNGRERSYVCSSENNIEMVRNLSSKISKQ